MPPAVSTADDDMEIEVDFESAMGLYWQRLFPFNLIHDWLRYGEDDDYIHRREIAYFYVIQNDSGDKGEGARRHLCYKSSEEFKADICKAKPLRIELGPVYNYPPRDNARIGTKYQAQERELIFDIDMDDYDGVRQCCQGKSVCSRCWHFMAIAIRVLEVALKDAFGFKHMLFVFSGRRGLHCWVADKRARKMSNECRAAVVEYISVIETAKVELPLKLHPFLDDVYNNILLEGFEKYILEEQSLLDDDSMHKVLDYIPNTEDRDALLKDWNEKGNKSSSFRWDVLKATVNHHMAKKKKGYVATNPIQNIVFAYTYPRLDANVSKQVNHLLKSPFSVHPSTGCALKKRDVIAGFTCIPVSPETCFDFNPSQDPPRLNSLIAELNRANMDGDPEALFEQTSLRPHIEYFRNVFLKDLATDVKREKAKAAREAGRLPQAEGSTAW